MDKIKRIQELTKELNQYCHEYYNLNKPTVSDSTYDKLFDELQKLEIETGFSLSNSPTKTVGYEVVSKLQKRTHPTPLKSLDKTKSIDELNKWRKGKETLGMIKADGLTVEVNFDGGQFIGGYTRGDSEIGEVISHNCRVFKNFPLNIPFKGKLRIVGEAIIHQHDFEEINSKLSEDDKYATPRNLCSGSVRQLNSEICAKRNVYFYAFGVLEHNGDLTDSKKSNFDILEQYGFTIVPNIWIGNADISETDINFLKNWAKNNGISIDGVVITFDSVEYSKSLGETSHHPLHSIAYKFKDDMVETVLRDVEWNTTRMGNINPVAIFDTVFLDNTKVNRSSLHNLSIIKGLNLDIGNRVLVSKRNLIIPYIEDNLDRDGSVMDFPVECPSCGENTTIKHTGTAEFLFCSNKQCPAQLLDKFVNFVKRDAMNIEGLSEATLEKFINKGFLKTFSDIYDLEKYKNEIVQMEGFGLKSYNRLIESINKTRKVRMDKFLVGLGIPEIGRSASKTIAKHFNNDWFKFEEALNGGFDFNQLKDFGFVMDTNLHNWYKDNNERKMWTGLTYILEFEKEEKKVNEFKSLEGLTFVVTGNVKTFKNRKELEGLISSLDGKLSGSVSSKTNYLINNDVTSNSGKNKKAKGLDVPIISEVEFNEMIGRYM